MRSPLLAVLPIVLAVLPASGHCDGWVGPHALLSVGVQSWLFVEDAHYKGGKLESVDAWYAAAVRVKEPGRPVTLHVLLPPGARVLEARFYPDLGMTDTPDTVLRGDVGARYERVEPKGRSEVEWKLLGSTWRWVQLDFEVTPNPKDKLGYSLLALKVRIPAVYDVKGIERLAGPKHFAEMLGSECYRGCIEWPVPLQPGVDYGFVLPSSRESPWDWELRALLYLWPGGAIHKLTDDSFVDVALTDHLMLEFDERGAGVRIVGIGIPRSPDEFERMTTEVIRSEWPRVAERFGFPYVPAVAVLSVERPETGEESGKGEHGTGVSVPVIPMPPMVPRRRDHARVRSPAPIRCFSPRKFRPRYGF